MTIFSNDHDITRIAAGLLDRTLPKSAWTHAGHFAAAIWLLRHRPDLTAPAEIRRIISAYNEATGTPNTDTGGYHHTITLASLHAASTHLAQYADCIPLHRVVNDLMASDRGHPEWLLAYWSHAELFSVRARHEWRDPDIAPLL